MMSAGFLELFNGIPAPQAQGSAKQIYAVAPVNGSESYFLGRDCEGYACVLASTIDEPGRRQSPIRLENLDAQFDIRCHVRRGTELERIEAFTVIRCRSLDDEVVQYFLSVCEVIVAMVGEKPRQRELACAIHRIAGIFQKLQRPPSRPVSGLFGELFLISRSRDLSKCVSAWRVEDTSRFDFAAGDIRIEVKSASGRMRVHEFSYEQCNAPPGTFSLGVSLFVERAPVGVSIGSLMAEIESRIARDPSLILKLHEVVSATLGNSLCEALSMTFDEKLAGSSLRFYNLRDIPAIRGSLPAGVSCVHFRSDLSALTPLSRESVIAESESFRDLLPSE